MKIVFCSNTADSRSSGSVVYYAGSGDKFWAMLHKTGLTPKILDPADFRSIRLYGMGLTGFDCGALAAKIKKYRPQVLCFNGKKPAKSYFGSRNIDYGWQHENIGATRIYVAPSTCGTAARYWDEKWWYMLADSVGINVTKIDRNNYFQADELGRLMEERDAGPGNSASEADFIDAISDVELHYSIPLHIKNMFEIARALFVYGYLYYPFQTLAIEQALKSLEVVVSYKYDNAGGRQVNDKGLHPSFAEKINYLYSKRLITRAEKEILHDCRQLRNMAFHPRYQQVLGHYDGALRTLARLMNEIWLGKR